jgi:hypothetical protein
MVEEEVAHMEQVTPDEAPEEQDGLSSKDNGDEEGAP